MTAVLTNRGTRDGSAPGAFFVTGTDTGIGKTYASAALMARARLDGLSVVGLKPVASGCRLEAGELRSDDALRLAALATASLPYSMLNPWAFEPAIAPHLAAEEAGVRITVEPVAEGLARARASAERVVVEGVGGWLVPLGPVLTTADLVRVLDLPVVLVVGLRLGCLSHALLTAESVLTRGLPLAGWVANVLDPAMVALERNVDALRERLAAPLLGVLPFAPGLSPFEAARHLRLPEGAGPRGLAPRVL